VRAAGIAASDSEHRAALALAEQARDWLTEQGFPLPAFCDSGNGGHLLYRVEIPGDDAGLVEQCLKVMARRWDTDAVHVDVTVFNPARIVRLYGCLNGKGDPEAAVIGRPHRRARLLHVPDGIDVASRERLVALAAMYDQAKPSATDDFEAARVCAFDIEEWIREHELKVTGPEPWKDGGRCWEFESCPWNSDHIRSAYIVELQGGNIGAGCHHNSCADKDWHALRDVVEPGWWEQKQKDGNEKS